MKTSHKLNLIASALVGVMTLAVTALHPAPVTAQEIIKDKPTPSRAAWAPLGKAYGRDYSTSDITKVVVIGSGTPVADTRHDGISVAVIVNGQPYIIDCGPGFWRNSQASTPAWRCASGLRGGPVTRGDFANVSLSLFEYPPWFRGTPGGLCMRSYDHPLTPPYQGGEP